MKYNVVTTDGYVVCDNCTLQEAHGCRLELMHIDKLDGTYEKGFYKIVDANGKEVK